MNSVNTYAFRDFTASDWEGYAGCESDNPQLAVGDNWHLVLDGDTLQLLVFDDDDYEVTSWCKVYRDSQEAFSAGSDFLSIANKLGAEVMLVMIKHLLEQTA